MFLSFYFQPGLLINHPIWTAQKQKVSRYLLANFTECVSVWSKLAEYISSGEESNKHLFDPFLNKYLSFDKKDECFIFYHPTVAVSSPKSKIFFLVCLFGFLFPRLYCCSSFIWKTVIRTKLEQWSSSYNAVPRYWGRTWRGYTLRLNLGVVCVFANKKIFHFSTSTANYFKLQSCRSSHLKTDKKDSIFRFRLDTFYLKLLIKLNVWCYAKSTFYRASVDGKTFVDLKKVVWVKSMYVYVGEGNQFSTCQLSLQQMVRGTSSHLKQMTKWWAVCKMKMDNVLIL